MKNISFAFIQQWFKSLFNYNKKPSVLGTDRIVLQRNGVTISTTVDSLTEGYTTDEELNLNINNISSTLSRLNTIYVSTVTVSSTAFLSSSLKTNAIRLTPSVSNKLLVPIYIHIEYTASGTVSINGIPPGGSNYFVVGTKPASTLNDYLFYLPTATFSTQNGLITSRFIDGVGLNTNAAGDALYLYGTNSGGTDTGFTATLTQGTISNVTIRTFYTLI